MKLAALFVAGILTGAVITVLAVGGQLDAAHLERRALQSRVLELEDNVHRLEEILAGHEHRAMTVQQVKVVIVNPPDPFVALDLEEAAMHLLSDLVGKDVATLDLRLVYNLVDGRVVEVEGKSYLLHVQGIHLFSHTEVMLKAEAKPNATGDGSLSRLTENSGYRDSEPSPVALALSHYWCRLWTEIRALQATVSLCSNTTSTLPI